MVENLRGWVTASGPNRPRFILPLIPLRTAGLALLPLVSQKRLERAVK